jgi:hypothetical protein
MQAGFAQLFDDLLDSGLFLFYTDQAALCFLFDKMG